MVGAEATAIVDDGGATVRSESADAGARRSSQLQGLGVRRQRCVELRRPSWVREEGLDVEVSREFPGRKFLGTLGLEPDLVAPDPVGGGRLTFRALGSVHVLMWGQRQPALGWRAASRPLENARGQEHVCRGPRRRGARRKFHQLGWDLPTPAPASRGGFTPPTAEHSASAFQGPGTAKTGHNLLRGNK